MTVRISKSAFSIREKLSELERPIGVKGNELMRAETAQDARDLVSAGRKNLLINGDFRIWQRGTTQSTNSYGSVDRWFCWGSNSTFSRSTDVPNESGFEYSIATSGTPTGEYIIAQAIELPVTGNAGVFYNGQIITVSYYAKSSVNGDSLRDFIAFRDSIGTSSNQSVVHSDTSIFHTLTTSWKRYERTYTIGVSSNGTNTSLVVMPRSTSTPSGNISITGVQVEAGANATEFEHRSYGEELALCERYCQGFPGGRIAVGNWNGSTQAFCSTALRTAMRATPTLFSYTAGKVLVEAVNWYAATTVSLTESSNTHVTFYITGISNSGQSSNANAVWGNGAAAVIQAEL